MEIRRWHLCIIVGCVLITHFEAKTVSLNKLIAAESKQKQEKVLSTKFRDFEPKTASPDALIAEESKQKQEKLPRTKFVDSASAKPCSQKEALPAEPQQRKRLQKIAGTASAKPRSQKETLPAESQQRERLHKIAAKYPRTQSISLKDLIAAEAKEHRRKLESFLSRSRGSGLLSNHRRLLPPLSFHNSESTESLFSRTKKQSPLNFQKTYEIKSPLRPRRLKHYFNPRYGRQAKSFKRESFENAKIRQKEIPIIRSLGLLVDDILSGSGESYEVKRPKHRRAKPKTGARRERKCKCNDEPDLEPADSKPDKKTVTIAPTVSLEVTAATEDTPTETSSPTTNNTTVGNVYTVRPDPNLSLLFTRNSTSRRRDYYGFSERSSPTLHRDVEGNITGNNGNDEHNSRGERNQTCPPDNEENPCGSARNDASGVGSIAGVYGNRNNPRDPDHRDETKKTKVSGDGDGFVRGDVDKYEKSKEFEIGGETKETVQTSGSVRLRGTLPKLAVAMDAESVQPEETGKESFFNVTHNFAGPERISEWSGAAATEDQRFRGAVETVNPINSLYPTLLDMNGSQNQIAPIFVETATPMHSNKRVLEPNFPRNNIERILVEKVTPKNSLNLDVLEQSQPDQIVTIFDGYSVARDINGRNRFSEKSIHISSE